MEEEIKDCECRESKNFVQPKLAQIIIRSRDEQTNQKATMSPTQKKMLTSNDNNDKKDNVLRIHKCSINSQYANINTPKCTHNLF